MERVGVCLSADEEKGEVKSFRTNPVCCFLDQQPTARKYGLDTNANSTEA